MWCKFLKSCFAQRTSLNRKLLFFYQQQKTTKTYTQQEYTAQPTYYFDVIAHYDQICKCQGQGGSISIVPSYPQYQISKKNQIIVKQRYTQKNYVYLLRLQFTTTNAHDEPSVRETINFPLAFDTLGEILYLLENGDEQIEIEESTGKGPLKLTVIYNKKQKRFEVAIQSQNGESIISISQSQYKLLCECMKQGLSIVTGWEIPDQFINKIEYKKTTSNDD